MKKLMCKVCCDSDICESGYCPKHEQIRLDLIKNIVSSNWWIVNKKYHSMIEHYSIEGLNETYAIVFKFEERSKKKYKDCNGNV